MNAAPKSSATPPGDHVEVYREALGATSALCVDLVPGEPQSISLTELLRAEVDCDQETGERSLRLWYRAGRLESQCAARAFGEHHYVPTFYRCFAHLATAYRIDGSVSWLRLQVL